jgi:uncharacterized surface protein with fasciclin (FAS1) repeats
MKSQDKHEVHSGGKIMKVRIALVALLSVLIPVGMAMAQQSTNMYDTLAAAGNFKTFLSAVDKANVQELKEMPGPFTLFAPTDEAFAKMPQETLDRIMGDPAMVRNVVYYHLTPGKYVANDLPGLKECRTMCPTTEPSILTFTKVDDKYMVNTANIVKPDVMAGNGVIHVIDAVLMPTFPPPKSS